MTPVTDPALLAQLNGTPAPDQGATTPDAGTTSPGAPANVTPAPAGMKPVTDPALLAQLNAKAPEATIGDKALAGFGGMVGGALKGIGQTLEAPLNLESAIHEKILNTLAEHGIIQPSTAQSYSQGRQAVKNAVEGFGQKILNFQQAPSAQAQAENPNTAAVGQFAGNVAGSSAVAGGILGKVAAGASPMISGAATGAGQGLLMGAGANSDNPIRGAAIGGVLGGAIGGVAGKLSRTLDVVADKVDDAERLGLSPYSEAGQKSIKASLDNAGKELTEEEIQKTTKNVLTNKIEAAAPQINLKQSPIDTITNLAKANYKDVVDTRKALYAPLNESKAVAQTPTLDSALSSVTSKTAKTLLPDALPANPTLSDMMAYRRAVSSGINAAETQVKMGTNVDAFKALQELNAVKQAATADLNTTASTVGLGDQLAKADAYHLNNFKPFEVYNTASGKLTSAADTTDTWTKVSRLLMPRRPDLTAMDQVAKTLGPQGKQIFGAAYLQQAVNRSMTVDGRIIPTKITMELNKMANSGLADHLLTPQLAQAFDGMRNIAEGALKTTKGMAGEQQGMIMKAINGLTHSSAGMNILIQASKVPASVGQIINQLGTAGAVKTAAAP